jgi:hypothetical protein
VVVALDLERDRFAAADVDDACILAGPLEDGRAAGREAAQEERRVLVAAVLRPEEREDRELEVVRLALQERLDAPVLRVRQAERAVERCRGDGAQKREANGGRGRLREPARSESRTLIARSRASRAM